MKCNGEICEISPFDEKDAGDVLRDHHSDISVTEGHGSGAVPDPLLASLTVQDALGVRMPATVVSDKIVGFYVGASWCPPCRQFSPVLCEFLERHHNDFAVIHVSLEHTEDDFDEYTRGKPWLNIRYDDEARDRLCHEWGVSMVPTLVVYSPRLGRVLTTWGRSAVTMRDADHYLEEWKAGRPGVSLTTMLRSQLPQALFWLALITYITYRAFEWMTT